MRNRTVIGIVGRMKSGKSTAAAALVSRLGFVEVCFAKPLKDTVQFLFKMTRAQLYNQEQKALIDPRYGLTPREIMQWFGQAVRDKCPGLWEMRMAEEVLSHPIDRPVVVSDVRYDAEAEAIKELGGIVIQIIRPESLTMWQRIVRLFDRSAWHKSERGIKKQLVDMVILNDGTEDQLRSTVLTAATDIIRRNNDQNQKVTH